MIEKMKMVYVVSSVSRKKMRCSMDFEHSDFCIWQRRKVRHAASERFTTLSKTLPSWRIMHRIKNPEGKERSSGPFRFRI